MLNILTESVKRASRSGFSMLARQIYLRMKIPMDFPLIVNVDPTNACNLLCTMCPNSSSPVVKKGFMAMDLYRKIIAEIAQREKRLYRFFLVKDGEPLLHKNILDMVALAKERNIAHVVTVVTNGVLMNKEKIDGFIETGLDDIGISLDAATRETYKKAKGKDEFDRVRENILRLVEEKMRLGKKNPVIRLKFVETEENAHEKQAFIDAWKGKVEKLEINPLHDWAGSVELDPTREMKKDASRYPCALLWYTMVINYTGDVSLCCIDYNWETVVGSVKEKTLSNIWNGPEMEKIRRRHVEGNYTGLPLCEHCSYWKIKENLKSFLQKKYRSD